MAMAAQSMALAFASPPGPAVAPPNAEGQRLRGCPGTGPQAGRPQLSGVAAATAATSLGLAALAASRLAEGARSRRGAARAARRAERPFAGGLVGSALLPGGDYDFDPLGLAERCEKFLPWFRESELKHGRVAMLAVVGLVVPEFARIPGPESCYSASVLKGLDACFGSYFAEEGLGPLVQVYGFIGFAEMLTTFPKFSQGLTLENAGDYKLGLNFLPEDAEQAKQMKLKELNNGRLAMLAFIGGMTQAQLTGTGFPWLYSSRDPAARRGPGLASGLRPAGGRLAAPRVARRAEGEGYKMSAAVPFLPLSPALEGMAGEEEGFDPMGFSLAIDARWLREAELKHARVCMLATVGWIATDLGLRVPGAPFEGVSSIEAHDRMVKFGSMPQLLFWIGCAEVLGFLAIINMMEFKTDRKPGDFGLRLGYPADAAGQRDMELKELRNGRLAMLAYSGIVTAAVLTQKPWPFFALGGGGGGGPRGAAPALAAGSALCGGTDSSRRAGTRAGPVAVRASSSKSLPFLPKPEKLAGFVGEEQEFDPLGFSDRFDMKWLRESELKHGRVCMLATVGFVAQQFITLPGMTPTADSLQAVYTAPKEAMATLIFVAGFIESASYGGKLTMLDMFEGDRVPGDFNFGSGALKGKDEKQVYDMKLKELNNGRLAMLAFSGMVHHNLVVKGPLFPLFPEGWEGPQNTWALDSVVGRLNSGMGGL